MIVLIKNLCRVFRTADITNLREVMMKSKYLDLILIIVVLLVSGVGIFYTKVHTTGTAINIYGDVVTFFGRGIYARESLFKGPIYVGTDLVLFLIASSYGVLLYLKEQKKLNIIKLGYYTIFTYYSASLAFGTIMNEMFLVYICLFSLSMFMLICALIKVDFTKIEKTLKIKNISRGHFVFLIIAGLSVSVWLFEIFGVIINGRPSEIIGMMSTEPTFVIDLAVVLPSCFASAMLLKKRKAFGVILSLMMMSLLAAVGLIVTSQTLFQIYFGIEISLSEAITYVFMFVVLSFFSLFFMKKSYDIAI